MLDDIRAYLMNRAETFRCRGAENEARILWSAAEVIRSGQRAMQIHKDIKRFSENITFHCRDILEDGVLY